MSNGNVGDTVGLAKLNGVTMATVRDTVEFVWEGGVKELLIAISGKTRTIFNPVKLLQINATVYAVDPSDESDVRVILKTTGLLSFVMFDGTRYAVQHTARGTELHGYPDNDVTQYPVALMVKEYVSLVDDFRFKFNPANDDNPYYYATYYPAFPAQAFPYLLYGTYTKLYPYGLQFTGTGTWGGAWIEELHGTPRTQAVLEAALIGITPCTFSFGFVDSTYSPTIMGALLNNGIGVVCTIGLNQAAGLTIQSNNNSAVTVVKTGVIIAQGNAGDQISLRIMVILRPVMSRVEIWTGTLATTRGQILAAYNVPTPVNTNWTAIFSVLTGSAILQKWWIRDTP